MGSLEIYPDPNAPPDFYAVSDWSKPRESSTPEWHRVIKLFDAIYAHPTIINKLSKENL